MTTQVTLIGTGLSGLTAALGLANIGLSVTLIGEMPATQDDERTTAILSPGIEYLKKLNLWSACSAQAVPLMTMELIDRDNSFVYDASETNLNEFGFNVSNALLRQTLIKAISKNKNITWLKENVSKATRKNNKWELTLASGKKINAALIIAADGRNSLMRQAAEIATEMRSEDQTALVMILNAEKPHHYTSVEWYRTGGPLTLVPMEGKKLAIVWCEQDDIAQAKKKLSLDALSQELTEITEKRFGQLTVTSKPQTWPIRPMKAERLVKDNIVLIGEAAHVLPPIGAQGFNTSVQDIMVLTSCLQQAQKLGLSVTDSAFLHRYETTRLKDMGMRYHSMTRLNDLIRSTHPAFVFLRGAGLRSLNRFSLLKKHIMTFGLGAASRHPSEDQAA